MEATIKGHLSIVELLLRRDVDIDATDNNYSTALIEASSNGHLEIAQLLLDENEEADLGASDKNGNTALIIATIINQIAHFIHEHARFSLTRKIVSRTCRSWRWEFTINQLDVINSQIILEIVLVSHSFELELKRFGYSTDRQQNSVPFIAEIPT